MADGLLGWARRLTGKVGLSARLVARARERRAAGDYRAAAILYEEALQLQPKRASLHVQCGHMFKEAGDLAAAERHYLAAEKLIPGDADLALQLGHFYRAAGRLPDAEASYRRALEFAPDMADPARELAYMHEHGWRKAGQDATASATPEQGGRFAFEQEMATLGRRDLTERLVPALVPRALDQLLHAHDETIDVRRLGRREAGYWGTRRTLRGIEAIRGFCISVTPLSEILILLNGMMIHRGPLKGGYELKYEIDRERVRKYVFNVWLDFSQFTGGLHALEVRLLDVDDDTRSFHEQVVIADPVDEAEYPDSDALVSVAPGGNRPVEEEIRTRSSMIRPALRNPFPQGVRNVLILRTDQLGDMVASVPAMVRLRELLPDARLVGLLSAANVDFAHTLHILDEILIADFPDDKLERRRVMPFDKQEALQSRLAPYNFDIAIDFSQSDVSRELLRLSGAKFLYGMSGGDWPWLSAEFGLLTRDRWSGLAAAPHSSKMIGMVEGLTALLKSSAPVMRRTDIDRGILRQHGIGPDDRFVLLHAGARVAFSRWPHYPQLASMILAETDLKVVMLSEDAGAREMLPPELLASDRFRLLDQRLTWDMFDGLLSFSTALVGNDSGPKHLAALRGTHVVTLFTARIDWREWGQENIGVVISRRVPCAGCNIFHDAEECGKDFACIVDIKPREVFDAVMAHV